ncbi:TlpA family protein disulfide reductase [Zunongwangia sp. H14]|uniref:TlpA family protein disulfide reductase n=1 Tax=Zunongwangia sp. H14 TaxID=3240792 RepID=UPI003566ED06
MRHYLIPIISVILLGTACNRSSNSSGSTYIGGEIVNPNVDYVVLSRNNRDLDTLPLDEDNQFGKHLQGLEAGIYTLKHPPENQILYLEPGDSLLIWLNTLQFDRSLNFSGRGGEKSNFLLDMFLNNQKDNDLILSNFKVKPEKFAQITDSIRQARQQKFEKLEQKQKFSDEFKQIAHTVINYEFYDLRERYSFLINKYYHSLIAEIPEDFHDYRDSINFNNKELQRYYVYTNLIDDYLRSKSIEDCDTLAPSANNCYNLSSYRNIKRRIILIDSLTSLREMKNEFLDRMAARGITMANTQERVDSIIQVLKEVNYENINQAKELATIHRNYFVGTSVNQNKLLNTSGEVTDYREILRKPTIAFVWSIHAPTHHMWQHKNIQELRRKYPAIDFIGINIDEGETSEWLRTLEASNYNKKFEYQITNRNIDKEVFRKYIYKIFFIDPSGIIVDGDAKIQSPNFETEILEFLNR